MILFLFETGTSSNVFQSYLGHVDVSRKVWSALAQLPSANKQEMNIYEWKRRSEFPHDVK